MQSYTYLLINLAIVSIPLLLTWHPTVHHYRNWKPVAAAISINAFLFIIWDVIFTYLGVWSFSEDYTLGLEVFGLPIEEIMFFFTVPYSMLFVYECLLYYLKDRKYNLQWVFAVIWSALLLLVLLHPWALYTVVVCTLFIVLMMLYQGFYGFEVSKIYLLYIGCSIIGFALVNHYLTSLPIVSYDDFENIGVRLGTIPFEDLIYMLLMNSGLLMSYVAFKSYFSDSKK